MYQRVKIRRNNSEKIWANFLVPLEVAHSVCDEPKVAGFAGNYSLTLLNITTTCCVTFNYRRRDPFASCFVFYVNT